MGYASYYENINDRIADLNQRVFTPTMRDLSTVADGGRTGRAEATIHEARVIAGRLESLRDELLDLATDPDVQLASQLAQARNHLKLLGDRLAIRDATIAKQNREHEHLRHELATERRHRRMAEQRLQVADRELKALVSEDRYAMERLLARNTPSVAGVQ